jgi:hypothetical protein
MTDRRRLIKEGNKFVSLMTGENLDKWGYTPVFAQCYLGGAGIAEALINGADIVVCGRVADAAPSVGGTSRDTNHKSYPD